MSDTQVKQDQQRKNEVWSKVLRWVIICFILGTICGLAATAKYVNDIKISTSDFDPNSLISKSSSVMCYLDPTTNEWKDFEHIGTESTGTRNNVYYEDLPQVLVDAVIATEDARFYKHSGIDLPRIMKAVFSLATTGSISSGGSTITQQLIKNAYYLSEEHKNTNKWDRKIGEILLARNVEKKVQKEDILVMYLNMIQFGYGLNTLGVSAASNYYFDKDVQELTLPEAALLAGVLNQPSKFDPYYNLAGATERRNTVLELMCRHGYISETEKMAAQSIPVENYLKKSTGDKTKDYVHYQSYYDNVLAELKELKEQYKDDKEKAKLFDPYETPMRIYTNMDVDLQTYIEEQVGKGHVAAFDNEVLEMSATLVETHSGKVLCTLGGREYVGNQNPYDTNPARTNRTRERHQPGSSLKPIITYAKAFDQLNWSTGHYISNETYMNYGIPIHNWDGNEGGKISLTDALMLSYNNPAMYTTEDIYKQIGAKGYSEYLSSFGFQMEDQPFDIQFCIGGWTHGVTTTQTAGAYSAISNDGTYIKPHFIYKIEYLDDRNLSAQEITDNEKPVDNVLTPEACFMIREVMRSYSKERYPGMNIPYNVCAKSGTTNYDDAICQQAGLPQYSAKDSLMNAFTEDYAVSVWVGYDTYNVFKALTETEKTYAGNIAGSLLTKAHSGSTEHSWQQPSDVVKANMIAGLYPYTQPFSDVPSEYITSAWFKKGHEPQPYQGGLAVPTLESFSAEYNEETETISVQFAPIKGSSAYDDIEYVVEISDGYNTIKKTSKDPSFDIEYSINNPTTVTGYYWSIFIPSNKISVDIETKASQNFVYMSRYTMEAINGNLDRVGILDALGVQVTYRGEEVPNDEVLISGQINLSHPGTYTIQIKYKSFTSDPITITVTDSSESENQD